MNKNKVSIRAPRFLLSASDPNGPVWLRIRRIRGVGPHAEFGWPQQLSYLAQTLRAMTLNRWKSAIRAYLRRIVAGPEGETFGGFGPGQAMSVNERIQSRLTGAETVSPDAGRIDVDGNTSHRNALRSVRKGH